VLEIPGVDFPREFALSVVEKIAIGEINDVYLCTGRWAGRTSEVHVKVAKQPKHCLANERAILEALAPGSIPVPRVLWYGETGRAVLVLESIAGRMVWDHIDPRREHYEQGKTLAYLRAYGECLGRIHAAPLAWAPQKRLRLEGLVGEENLTEAHFMGLVSWLERHAPPKREQVFVHGDFNTSNVLFQAGAPSGVLDWEFAGSGWREYDLAWTLRARTAFLGSQAERDAVLEGYREHSQYDPEALRWCEVLNYLHFAHWNSSGEPDYAAFALRKARELAWIA
jgi:aminoglycoside phosphotransferase (APT) family kinase protein